MAEKTNFINEAENIPTRSCFNCAYHFVNILPNMEVHECRFGPPVVIPANVKNALGHTIPTTATLFPVVSAWHWCWQFNPKNKALAA